MKPKSVSGRDEVLAQIQRMLLLPTKKESDHVFNVVVASVENTLLTNLGTDGFTIKLNSLGKLTVRHRPSLTRKIPFTGEIKRIPPKRKVRFVSLGKLRQCE